MTSRTRHRFRRDSLCLGLLAVGLFGLTGCGSSTWPTSGKVVFQDGSPVTSGVIEFSPAAGGPVARAAIGSDGRFDLTTGNDKGAVAGPHRVVIVQVGMADGFPGHVRHKHPTNRDPKAIRFVDARYRQFETSKLQFVVEPHKNNEFVIEVESAD